MMKVVAVSVLEFHLSVAGTRGPLGGELVYRRRIPPFMNIVRGGMLVQVVGVQVFTTQGQLLLAVVASGGPFPHQIGDVEVFASVAGTMRVPTVVSLMIMVVVLLVGFAVSLTVVQIREARLPTL